MSNADEGNAVGNPADHPQNPPDVCHGGQPNVSFWRQAVNWLNHEGEDEGRWLENMRGMLSLVSTMIATITFQLAVNPPGGVFPASADVTYDAVKNCTNVEYDLPCAGEAVLAVLYQYDYHRFQTFNTISFVASLSVTLLLISGVPLNHKFPIWILSIGMIVILTCLAFTFLYGTLLVTPTDRNSWGSFMIIYKRTIITWIVLVGMVGLFLTIRFLVWSIKKCIQVFKA